MPFDKFYQAMVDGAETSTSQVNADEFEAFWQPYLEKGWMWCISRCPRVSAGVINSANLAKEHMEAKFPERKIYVVDSLGASSGYGLLMDKLADLRDEGMSAADLRRGRWSIGWSCIIGSSPPT